MSIHNGQAFLDQAARSILDQDLAELELIAVDDGSTDRTWRMLEALADRDRRVAPLRNPANLGLTASLNRGLALARGQYLARQDVDDLSLPGRLSRQAAFLDSHPGVVLLGADIEVVDERGRPSGEIGRRPRSDAAIRRYQLVNNAFFHSTVMLRRAALADHGLAYDESLAYAQDFDLWSRLLEHGQGANLAAPLVRFRRHAGQLSEVAWAAQQAVADRVARTNLARLGLEARLTPDETTALRRLGFAPRQTPGGERLKQARALRRFMALLREGGLDRDAEWPDFQAELWGKLCRYLLLPPRDAAGLRAMLAILAGGPGALIGGLAWLARGR